MLYFPMDGAIENNAHFIWVLIYKNYIFIQTSI